MTISGRTEQLDILCHVTGYTSDFLSFIVAKHIQFFHRAFNYIQKEITLCLHDVQCTIFVHSTENMHEH